MTTIAWDGETLAVDSLATYNDVRYDTINKLYRTKGGGVLAAAGSISVGPDFVKWFNGDMEAPEYPPDTLYQVVYFDPNKKLWVYWSSTKCVTKAPKKGAAGTGQHFALAALDLGASAEEAVKSAIKRDVYSGGKIRSVRYKE